jgi:hypothetical protein
MLKHGSCFQILHILEDILMILVMLMNYSSHSLFNFISWWDLQINFNILIVVSIMYGSLISAMMDNRKEFISSFVLSLRFSHEPTTPNLVGERILRVG